MGIVHNEHYALIGSILGQYYYQYQTKFSIMRKPTIYFALIALLNYCTLSSMLYAQEVKEPAIPDNPTHLRSQDSPEFEKSRVPEAKTERIHLDESSAQIDELRVRGETQSIQVTPKGRLPTYEVEPNNAAASSGRNTGGKRVWRVLNF